MSYIVLVGGQLQNKGAQAMTFTVVDELKKRYPEKEVILFSSVYSKRDEMESKDLNFKVLSWPMRAKSKILGLTFANPLGKKEFLKYLIKGTGITSRELKEIKSILKKTDLMIDISGYALSSQREFRASLNYLYNIMIAEKYNIPVVLFPQSFGPFNYSKQQAKIVMPLIQKYLNYPEKIYAREKDGLKHLSTLNLNNVEHSLDSVLQSNKQFTLSHIFKSHAIAKQKLKNQIEQNSVAIVPNEKIMLHGNQSQQYNTYKIMIKQLLDKGKNVYLIRHSFEDLEICRNIKKEFLDNDNVILLEDDFNCVVINEILCQLDFIIASRYHSIIHAYKNGVPAIVFGWAVKYQELLNHFSQNKFLFDVRENQETNKILKSLNLLIESHKEESSIINEHMKNIRKSNLFDKLTVKIFSR